MNILLAFFAGLFTFFSPCVLPLIPSYISYITGFSVEELSGGAAGKLMKKSFLASVSFVAGFSLIFVLLGIFASFAGSAAYSFQNYLRTIGGVLVIIFGLIMTGALDLKFLEMEKRISLRGRPAGYLGALLLGMTFAAGWVPCVGPMLSSMLVIASTSGSRFFGGALLFSYCMGLGLPIIASAVAFNYFLSAYKSISRYLRVISVTSGVILIIIGLLLITDNLTLISNQVSNILGFRGL